jgi:hypothetical protein
LCHDADDCISSLWLFTQAVSCSWFGFSIGLIAPFVEIDAASRRDCCRKGHHDEFNRFLDHLFAQLPYFRVIFSVETADDAAVAPIETWRSKLPDRVALVIAGLANDEGQKIANLRAALAHITPADEIVVFADADIRPSRDWLKRLVAPLLDAKADVVSGFAWLVVDDRSFSTCVMTSMAATMVTAPRIPLLNAVWGRFRRDVARKCRRSICNRHGVVRSATICF